MPDFSAATLAQLIKTLRLNRNMTQQDVADAIHVSKSTVGNWEDDKAPTELPASGIRGLARLFSCTADYLCGLSDHPQPFRPGDWIVDLDVVDRATAGTQPDAHEAVAVPIPPRFRVCTSTEYAALRSQLRDSTGRKKKQR